MKTILNNDVFNGRKCLLIIIYLCFYLSSCTHESMDDLSVMTYNIRYASFNEDQENWNNRKEGVVNLLHQHDFVGLQEATPVQINDIMEAVGEEYGLISRTREKDPTQGEASPLLFKKDKWQIIDSGTFWLSSTPDIPGSNTWGAAYNRVVSYGIFKSRDSKDSIMVVNTHYDHVSQEARIKSTILIKNRLGNYINKLPFVFMGDLNVEDNNDVYAYINAEMKLKDSYREIQPEFSFQDNTFHGWISDTAISRIDYIFINNLISVRTAKVNMSKSKNMYPSDHLPLEAVISIVDTSSPVP
jgi:endonuclease/exonuclease/phosphatase family metal-dependent hydrolase